MDNEMRQIGGALRFLVVGILVMLTLYCLVGIRGIVAVSDPPPAGPEAIVFPTREDCELYFDELNGTAKRLCLSAAESRRPLDEQLEDARDNLLADMFIEEEDAAPALCAVYKLNAVRWCACMFDKVYWNFPDSCEDEADPAFRSAWRDEYQLMYDDPDRPME